MGQRYGAHHRSGRIHVNGGARINAYFRALMHHEMTHAVLAHRRRNKNIPTWLNEGIAEWFDYKARDEHGLSSTNKMLLRNAFNQSKRPQLTWKGWLPRNDYILSYAAVLFIEDKFGRDTLWALARDLSNGEPLQAAFKSHLGVDREDLLKGVRRWIGNLRN